MYEISKIGISIETECRLVAARQLRGGGVQKEEGEMEVTNGYGGSFRCDRIDLELL